jgi:hypothetical protein
MLTKVKKPMYDPEPRESAVWDPAWRVVARQDGKTATNKPVTDFIVNLTLNRWRVDVWPQKA